jgi:Family of unknown function (DUF5985)
MLQAPTVFLAGMVTMGFLTAGAFFIRFWRRSREGRFLAFAAGFWLLAANQAILVLFTGATDGFRGGSYVIRFGAFLLIVAAVLRLPAGWERRR